MKNSRIVACTMAGVVGAGIIVPMLINNRSIEGHAISVYSVPENIKSATVSFFDNEWNECDTNATVTVNGGTANVSDISQSGYYTVTFADDEFEVGTATFFYGESGQMYSYEYNYDESKRKYVSDFKAINSLEYTESDYARALSVNEGMSIQIYDVPSEVVKADVYLAIDDSHYGEAEISVTVDGDSKAFISDIGRSGEYTIDFYADGEYSVGYATFVINENKEFCYIDVQFNPDTNQIENIYIPNDIFYFINSAGNVGAADTEEIINITTEITGIPSDVTKIEVQYLTDDMISAETTAQVNISNGNVVIDYLESGYYTLNFYNDTYDTVGYSTFYMDFNGNFFTYDRTAEITSPEYITFEEEFVYTTGNMSVNVYDVPDTIDTVEVCYKYGSETDEAVWFEPDISSVYKDPVVVSGFGLEGDYQIVFYKENDIAGYADFYLDKSGKTYYHDVNYNASTGKIEDTLKKADKIYYYIKNSIGSAENYSYGNTKLTITGVPDDAVSAEVTDFENDDTFTVGLPIFPEVNIKKNGTAVIENFGERGYYEIDFVRDDDSMTKVGYLFIRIDDNMNIYTLEYEVNPDTYQLETIENRTDTAALNVYESVVRDYSYGNKSATVKNVSPAANRMLVSCSADNGSFSYYESEIHPDINGNAVIEKLGTAGEYNVIFMNEKTELGTASFRLSSKGTVTDMVEFEYTGNAVNCETGDLDFNGSINIADLVIMQRYLLAAQKISSSQFYVADLYNDGKTDVFDMIVLRKKLIENMR